MKDFLRRREWDKGVMLLAKSRLAVAKSPSLGEGGLCQVDYLTSANQVIQVDWVKIPFLREAETVITLGVKSLWGLT